MSRHQRPEISIIVDGLEIKAPDGRLLVDAAKSGDVEIPVFCYEPKLGAPVGACRMCLVEIEGIPKLQTACSTPIRDGMVVHTRTERVKEAQNAVVEFLLVNHPLDCPVCDKGGECPLQDISMGWGEGKTRVTDPKRHFQKPIPLSPLVKIDRERCILCYRCARFSQEVSEDEQLQLLERGPRSYIGTHDDRPYASPFHGNIIELCPVGALTSQTYRFRARPWDIEDAGSVCTLCPSQCNVKFTVRDEAVVRVLGRDNAEVDDGWLCDKGRFGFQMFSSGDRPTGPLLREGGALRTATWNEAIARTAAGLGGAKGKVAAIVGGGASNEEAYLIQRIVRRALGSPHLASTEAPALPLELRSRLSDPALGLATSAIDGADAILVVGVDPIHEMPILELRIRKAVRRHAAKLLVATERPTALDGGAAVDSTGALEGHRYEPGKGAAFLNLLAAGLLGNSPDDVANDFAAALKGAEDVAIIFGEQLHADGPAAAEALLRITEALGLGAKQSSGLYEVPIHANGRGIREVGCTENAGPGFAAVPAAGKPAAEIRDALEAGELKALILWDVDPVRDFDDPAAWSRAIGACDFTLSVSMFGSASAQSADVHFPLETHAEKEGTVTHPDGRLQRVRPSVPHPGDVASLWQVLVELAEELGDATGFQSQSDVLAAIAAEVSFYGGASNEVIGGVGIRPSDLGEGSDEASGGNGFLGTPPETSSDPSLGSPGPPDADERAGREAGVDEASEGLPKKPLPEEASSTRAHGGRSTSDGLVIGSYTSLWGDYVAERNPALEFLSAKQTLELGVRDAAARGLRSGDQVTVSAGGASINAVVAVRERIAAGTAFLLDGIREDSLNKLPPGTVEIAKVEPADEAVPEPIAVGVSEREAVQW